MKIAESAFAGDSQSGGLPTSVRMVLIDVFEHPGSSIGEVTARTGFPQSHVSASVARLRDRGVLETSVDAGDGRRTLVRLAGGFGDRIAARAAVPIEGALAAQLASSDPQDLVQVIDALDALAERIIPRAPRRTRIATVENEAD